MSKSLRDLNPGARRTFLKLAGAVGAAYAIERSKVFDYLVDSGGEAFAQAATCESKVNRSVHLVGGNGSLGWFALLWPPYQIGKNFQDGFAYHAGGQGTDYTEGGKPFWYAPEAPLLTSGAGSEPLPNKGVTAIMAGVNETHIQNPDSPVSMGGSKMLAVIAAIQRQTPALLPVIGVGPVALGSAPNMPSIATVPTAEGMVDLFNSAASRVTLAAQEDKELYETYYKAMLGLRALSSRPTARRAIEVTKTAAGVLGTNLADDLRPAQADLDFYGVPDLLASQASAPAKRALENLARALITTAKAMSRSLTNSVVIAMAPESPESEWADPHQAPNSMALVRDTVAFLGRIIDSFYRDLATRSDPSCQAKNLADTVVLTAHGDTPHDPRRFAAWPDATAGNSNWLYVMGNGYIKPGWFGDYKADGSTMGFDPASGADVAGKGSADTSAAAGAAIAYAVAKGDMETVKRFYSGDAITGMIKQPT